MINVCLGCTKLPCQQHNTFSYNHTCYRKILSFIFNEKWQKPSSAQASLWLGAFVRWVQAGLQAPALAMHRRNGRRTWATLTVGMCDILDYFKNIKCMPDSFGKGHQCEATPQFCGYTHLIYRVIQGPMLTDKQVGHHISRIILMHLWIFVHTS